MGKRSSLHMKSFSVENMKSFKEEACIDIRPITIFVGKNSCGKSSLIRFPVVLSQSIMSDADTPIMFFGKNIDYGNYEDVIYGHKGKKMRFSVTYNYFPDRYFFRMSKKNKYSKFLQKECDVTLKVGITKYSKRIIVDTCEVFVNNECGMVISRLQNEKYRLSFRDILDNDVETSFPAKHFSFYKFIPMFSLSNLFDELVDSYYKENGNGNVSKKECKILRDKVYGGSYELIDEEQTVKNNELTDDEKEIWRRCWLIDFYSLLLQNVRMIAMQTSHETYYIGPFRENPNRVYRDAEHKVDSVGVRGENVSVMLKNDYTHGKKILSGVSEWLMKSMGYKLGLKDIGSGLYNIVVKKEDGTEDNLIDVGYGISQVLPIVAQIVNLKVAVNRGRYFYGSTDKMSSMFIIEQPELHLHPGAQAELANLFVEAVSGGIETSQTRVLIETHSEHMIRRLQALIADKSNSITNEHVKIYYIDKNERNEAFVTEMKIAENGQFINEWPSGFFDKAHELSMELLKNNFK